MCLCVYEHIQCGHSPLPPSPPMQVKCHTCRPTLRGYVRPTSLTQNWPRSLPDNMQALLRHSTEYLWSRQHSEYIYMTFCVHVKFTLFFFRLTLCFSAFIYMYIELKYVFISSPSLPLQTCHFRAPGNAESCRRPQ